MEPHQIVTCYQAIFHIKEGGFLHHGMAKLFWSCIVLLYQPVPVSENNIDLLHYGPYKSVLVWFLHGLVKIHIFLVHIF